MSNKYKYSNSDSDDSESDDEDFINQFKNQQLVVAQKSAQTINSQQNEDTKTDTESSLNGMLFKSKIQEQSNQSQGVVREDSNNSILNSQGSQPLHFPAKKIKKNLRQIQSDDSDEEDQQTQLSSRMNKSKQEESNQYSGSFSRTQQQKAKQMSGSSSNGNSQFSKTQSKEVKFIREPAFPTLDVPSSHEDLVISTKKYKEIEGFFNEIARGSNKNIFILQGSSGVGKKTLISYLAEKKFKWQILHLHRMKKLQQSAENDQSNEDDSRALTNNSYLENPVELLLYALNRSLSANLYKNEVIVMQELPESASFQELRRISEFINKRYIKARIKKNPIVFILNTSIYSTFQVSKIFKEQCPEFYISNVVEIKPSDKEIQSFVQKQMNNNIKFQAFSGYQRNGIIQDIVATANGDISNALNQLKMVSYSKVPSSSSLQNKKKGEEKIKSQDKQKDNEFSIFHTFGKFLYNKRKMKGSSEEPRQMTKEELLSGKTEFYFDPMHMIQQINCNQNFFRSTLQQNYLDFYGSIEDVVKQSSNFVLCDIFDRQNFHEKNEIIKEENDYLSSFIVGEGVMLNNLHGKEVKKKYQGIVKSQIGDVNIEKKVRQQNLKKQFPFLTLSKYVLEYNHHLSLNPAILAQDLMKQKGTWNQQKQIEENTNNINSIGFDQLSDESNEQNLQPDKVLHRNMVLFRKDITHKEIIEDDIEEC